MREGSPPPTNHVSHFMCHVSCVMCHMSNVTCHVSRVTCYMSQFLTKGTQGFIHCSFKDDLLAMLNKQMLFSLATYDALSWGHHKVRLYLAWVHIVDMCTALVTAGRGKVVFIFCVYEQFGN